MLLFDKKPKSGKFSHFHPEPELSNCKSNIFLVIRIEKFISMNVNLNGHFDHHDS